MHKFAKPSPLPKTATYIYPFSSSDVLHLFPGDLRDPMFDGMVPQHGVDPADGVLPHPPLQFRLNADLAGPHQ